MLRLAGTGISPWGGPLGTPCAGRCSPSPQGHTTRGHRQSMSLPLTWWATGNIQVGVVSFHTCASTDRCYWGQRLAARAAHVDQGTLFGQGHWSFHSWKDAFVLSHWHSMGITWWMGFHAHRAPPESWRHRNCIQALPQTWQPGTSELSLSGFTERKHGVKVLFC